VEKFKAGFDVIYHPGELRAVGYRAEKSVVEGAISTTGDPAQIHLSADRELIQADGFSLSYMMVEVLDGEGRRHPTVEDTIYFTINGPGKIIAVGNSNPISEELYVGNQRKVFRGRALVVVKSTAEPGQIRLTAQADGLEGAEIMIKSFS
jgi:beta-galactosidase